MENEIFVYTLGFLTVRLSALVLFGYAIYLVLRPQRAVVRSFDARPRAPASADAVADDRC